MATLSKFIVAVSQSFVTFLLMKQLLKSDDLFMDSGDVVVTSSMIGSAETDFFFFFILIP